MNKIIIGLKNLDKDTYKIIYKCQTCMQLHKNIVAIDDDFDKIIELSKNIL